MISNTLVEIYCLVKYVLGRQARTRIVIACFVLFYLGMEAEVLSWNDRKFLPDHISSYTIILHLQCCKKFSHECMYYEKSHVCRQLLMTNAAELSLDSVVTYVYKTCCWHGGPDCADGLTRYGPDVHTGRDAHLAFCTRVLGFFPGSQSARAWRWPWTFIESRS